MNIYIVGFILLLISISPPVLANKKDCETLLNNYKEIKKKHLLH